MAIVVPTAIPQVASNIGGITTRINGKITDDGGASCEARFRYRKGLLAASLTSESIPLNQPYSSVIYNGFLYLVGAASTYNVAKVSLADYSYSVSSVFSANYGGQCVIQAGGYMWASIGGVFVKFDPDDLSLIATYYTGLTESVNVLCADDTYVYGGGMAGSFSKCKISDGTITENTQQIPVSSDCACICQDGDYLYGVTHNEDVSTGVAFRVRKSDLAVEASVATYSRPLNNIEQDTSYFYVVRYTVDAEDPVAGFDRFAKSDLSSSICLNTDMGSSLTLCAVDDKLISGSLTEPHLLWIANQAEFTQYSQTSIAGIESLYIAGIIANGTDIHVVFVDLTTAATILTTFNKADILATWTTTDWQNTLETNNEYYEDLTDLDTATEYKFQTQAKNSAGEGDWSSSEYFDTVDRWREFFDAMGRLIGGQNNFPYIFPFSFYVNVTGRAIQSGTGARVLGSVSGRFVAGRNNFPYTFPFSFYTNVAGRTIEEP